MAILLELAWQLGPEGADLPFTVRLIFLGSEENGYHGASAYVDGLTQAERDRHLAVFNMDISAADADAQAQLVCMTLGGGLDGPYREGNFLEAVDNTPRPGAVGSGVPGPVRRGAPSPAPRRNERPCGDSTRRGWRRPTSAGGR